MINFFKSRLINGKPLYLIKNKLQKKKNGDKYFELLLTEYGSINSIINEIKNRYSKEWNFEISKELKKFEFNEVDIAIKAINEYKKLVEEQFCNNFINNGGIKSMKVSNRGYANLRRILYGLTENQRIAYLNHKYYGKIAMPMLPGSRNNNNKIKENIICIESSDLEDSVYLDYINKKNNNIGKLIIIPISDNVEETIIKDTHNLSEEQINEFSSLLLLTGDHTLEKNNKYWTVKKLKSLLRFFNLKTTAPRKATLIDRIVNNLSILKENKVLENDKAKIKWKKIEKNIGKLIIRYRSMRMELINLLKKIIDNNYFNENINKNINIGIRFYGDGGNSCCIPFLANYIGIIWDKKIFNSNLSKKDINNILELKLWCISIGPETKFHVSIIEQIKGNQLLGILDKPFYYKGIIILIIYLFIFII